MKYIKYLFLSLLFLQTSAFAFNSNECSPKQQNRLCSIYGIQAIWVVESPGLLQLKVSFHKPIMDKSGFVVDSTRTDFKPTGFYIQRVPAEKFRPPYIMKHRDGSTKYCYSFSSCQYDGEAEWLEYVDIGFPTTNE